jgi:hypothetical protein
MLLRGRVVRQALLQLVHLRMLCGENTSANRSLPPGPPARAAQPPGPHLHQQLLHQLLKRRG